MNEITFKFDRDGYTVEATVEYMESPTGSYQVIDLLVYDEDGEVEDYSISKEDIIREYEFYIATNMTDYDGCW